MEENMNIAVIDLGSNSLRMTISKVHDGKITQIESYKKMVRLSEGASCDNILKDFAVTRTLSALEEFYKIIKNYSCEKVFAVATQAVRAAKNKEDFLNKAKDLGFSFEVISGEEEAYLGFLAVRETFNMDCAIVLDIGGGSAEFVLVKGGNAQAFASLPLGAVALSEKFKGQPVSKMYKYVTAEISKIPWLDEACFFDIYGIGGTIRTLGKMLNKKAQNERKVHGFEASYKSVSEMFHKIIKTPIEERKKIPGLDEDRIEIIHGGIMPLKVLMDILSSKSLHISVYGLREGVLIAKRDEIL